MNDDFTTTAVRKDLSGSAYRVGLSVSTGACATGSRRLDLPTAFGVRDYVSFFACHCVVSLAEVVGSTGFVV